MGTPSGMTDLITSRTNSKVKFIRNLKAKKSSRKSGFFVIEGIHHVGEALDAMHAGHHIDIEGIYYAPELLNSDYAKQLIQKSTIQGIPGYALSESVFTSLADKENPQGILAVARRGENRLFDLTPQNFVWGVALVSPQDPGNIGTIMRTIDAVGASGLILLDGGADPFHSNGVRASMGTLFWRPVVETSFDEFSGWVTQYGYHVIGTSAHATENYRETIPYLRPVILLMGSEQKGLSQDQAALCEHMVSLPMQGRASSLNLAVATGVLLYAMGEGEEMGENKNTRPENS